jgi:hypothetical protein
MEVKLATSNARKQPLGRLLGWAAAKLAGLDDRINPIAVKELRQAVQAKYISGVLLLLLMGQLVAMAAIVLGRGADELDVGRQAFLVLFGILAFSCMVFLPLYVAGRLFAERVAADVDLFSITALRPRAVVWGRLSSGVLLTVLVYAASAPFLAFTLLLRGIDRPSVFALLLAGFVGTAFLLQFAVFLACLPVPRQLRPLLSLVAIGAGFFGFLVAMSFAAAQVDEDLFSRGGEVWRVFGAVLVLSVLATAFFFALSVALVSPRAANRAFPVRACITVAWAVSFGVVALWSATIEMEQPVRLWGLVWVCLLCLGLAIAMCEPDAYGPRVARTIPRSGLLRLPAFLLYTGAAGGVAWACLLIGLTLAAGAMWDANVASAWRASYGHMWYYYGERDTIAILGGCSVYFYCYCMTASLIRRRFLPGNRQAYTLLIMLLVVAVTFLPAFVGGVTSYKLDAHDGQLGPWYVTTPIILTDHYYEDYGTTGLLFAGVWAVIVTLLNAPWLAARSRAFRRPDDAHVCRSQALNNE